MSTGPAPEHPFCCDKLISLGDYKVISGYVSISLINCFFSGAMYNDSRGNNVITHPHCAIFFTFVQSWTKLLSVDTVSVYSFS